MAQQKLPKTLETAFSTYTLSQLLGEGGAGKVFAATSGDGSPVAIKILASERATTDSKKRFRNETSFLMSFRHKNIVSVIDYGIVNDSPFYVMDRYECSLRAVMAKGISPDSALSVIGRILDGIEAAHLRGVVHRDLKPENILMDLAGDKLALADFGVAHFAEDLTVTPIDTLPAKRLANFQYAAPEQRTKGGVVTHSADLYAIGLIMNELFTGTVPHGSAYKQIASVAGDFAFLDDVVDSLISQDPKRRLASVQEVKHRIQLNRENAVSLQKISAIDRTVIPQGEIDDPLALEPVKIVSVDWRDGILTLTLDKVVHDRWNHALLNMGNYTAVYGRGPDTFRFVGNKARVPADESEAQRIINHFKEWAPSAMSRYKQQLQSELTAQTNERLNRLRVEKEAEELRLRIMKNLTF